MERVEPMVITIDEGTEQEKKYTLEYSRESVVRINKMGFKTSEVIDNIEEMLPLLFYGAFYKNHPTLTKKDTTDILLNKLGGLSDVEVDYLSQLYLAPRQAMVREGDVKNSRVSVMIPSKSNS